MSHSCCGGCGGGCCRQASPVALNREQKEFLVELTLHGFLPLARLIRTSSVNDTVYIVALQPVYLITTADSMETVKETGRFLTELADAGLISLDYGAALDGYPYLEYRASEVFEYFCKVVREGAAQNPDFLGDTPHLELGSIAITELGKLSLAQA